MNRLAIGYDPTPEEIERPVMVFVETREGVLVQTRGEPPRLVERPEHVRINGDVREVAPGDPSFFDVVLDGFSTKVFIRNVTELEPEVITSMLVAEENWDLLPRAGRGLVVQ
jgi:hypothetical protein